MSPLAFAADCVDTTMMRIVLIALVPTPVARSARGALAMSMRGRKLYAAG